MEVRYDPHARMRMRERGITELEVEAVLRDHHTSYTDRKGNPIYIGHPNGRRIKVVVRLGSDPPYVITAAD